MESYSQFKITLKLNEIVIEIPITPAQQEQIVQKAMGLVYGEGCKRENFLDTSCEFVLEELEHQRCLLLQLHQNRRTLEQQAVLVGKSEISIRVSNELSQVNMQIEQVGQKINALSRKLLSLQS